MAQDSMEILHEIVKRQSEKIDGMHEDLHEIKVDIAVMKERAGLAPSPKKEKVAVAAAGGGIGAVAVAVINFILEHFGRGH